jgi:hypothetical protein
MTDITYYDDISAYIEYGNKQNSSGFPPTTHDAFIPAEAQDLTTKTSIKSTNFRRVAVVTGLIIVSAPIAIASSIVLAVPCSLFLVARSIKADIHEYIKAPQEERNFSNFIGLLIETIMDSIVALLTRPFLVSMILTVDLSLLLVTYLTHTNHMQNWNNLLD